MSTAILLGGLLHDLAGAIYRCLELVTIVRPHYEDVDENLAAGCAKLPIGFRLRAKGLYARSFPEACVTAIGL